MTRAVLAVAALATVAVVLRDRLVGVLTATTGTWVGSPPPPRRGDSAGEVSDR